MQEPIQFCRYCQMQLTASATACRYCGRDQRGELGRAFKIDFFAPVLIFTLLLSYILDWIPESSYSYSRNGFELWGRILDRNSTSGPAAMFLILLALSTLAIFALYIVNLVHSSSGSESSYRGMLHIHWIRGGAAILASFSSFFPTVMMADRIGSRTPGAGFIISILVSIGLFISGTVSIILAAIALNRTRQTGHAVAYPYAPPPTVCSSCGAPIRSANRYCVKCGASRQAESQGPATGPRVERPAPRPEPAMPACPKCGAALPAAANFCVRCGASRQTQSQAPSPTPATVPAQAPAQPAAVRAEPAFSASSSFCTRCGAPISSSSPFCTRCGVPTAAKPPAPAPFSSVGTARDGGWRMVGNVLWVIFGGFFLFLHYLASSILLFLTIIGIPFGLQTLKLSFLALWPFGKEVFTKPSSGCLSIFMNVIWILIGGIWLALHHLLWAIFMCITIIGIPFAIQHVKLAGLALVPFGRDIRPRQN